MMKHPEFDRGGCDRLRLELDSSDRKNLVGSQIIPDKSASVYLSLAGVGFPSYRLRTNSDFLHVDYDAKPGPGLFRVRDANQALAECRHFGDILPS